MNDAADTSPPAPAPAAADGAGAEPTPSEQPAPEPRAAAWVPDPPPTAPAPVQAPMTGAAGDAADRPELLVAGAFAAGVLAARILKRLAH